MKKLPFYITTFLNTPDGGRDIIVQERRGDFIETPKGYIYAINYERPEWCATDLLTGLNVCSAKTIPALQQMVLEREERCMNIIRIGLIEGRYDSYVKYHELIKAELAKREDNQIPARIQAYIITKGWAIG